MKNTVEAGATVISDEYQLYCKIAAAYTHTFVRHGAKEHVNEMAHTNGLEGFWNHFKRTVGGI